MTADDVGRALDVFDAAGIAVWIGEGWGVDALVGRPTRQHADLDLMFDRGSERDVIRVLGEAGLVETLDRRPGRFVISDGRWELDLHPVEFAGDGSAIQRTHDGRRFDYPADGFTSGTIAGRPVPCIAATLQREFHRAYEPTAEDLHDLELLDRLLGHESS